MNLSCLFCGGKMLSLQQDLAPGIGRFSFSNLWNKIASEIIETIDEFYDKPVATGFYPHFNEITLRQAVLSVSSELNILESTIKQLMDAKYCAIFLDKLHLQSFSEVDRYKLLYALSLSIGYPTPTDNRKGKILWDVKPRSLPAGHFVTYSENSHYADLHSDSQFCPHPEKYFFLYTIRAARCGGGKSLICDGRAVRDCLLETKQGREAYEVLSTFKFPFWVPSTFNNVEKAGSTKAYFAPIFGDVPLIRFRYDTLKKGFELNPDLDVPKARKAIKVFLDILENEVNIGEYYMPDDTLVLCNNHRVLHGRTSFQDRERHLIRVRISNQPQVLQPTILATA
jgi:Taurine catabolism dioxygenase TauD, TfdA family